VPYHVRAGREDIAPAVVGVGDPARAELYASLMEGARPVSAGRYLVYTGRVRGKRVTVAAHGIGGPSIAILLEELRQLGMEVFIRIGTAGSLGQLRAGDVLVAAAAAAPAGGLFGAYFPGYNPPLSADPVLTARLAEALKAPVGYVVSSDAFYVEDEGFARLWRERGAAAVEMECAAAMALGWLRGFRVGCVLVISNVVGRRETAADLRDRLAEVFMRVVDVI